MKKKFLALFVTLALALTPAAFAAHALAPDYKGADAVIVSPLAEGDKTVIEGTWENGRFAFANPELEDKVTAKYVDAEGTEVTYDALENGKAYTCILTIGEEFAEEYEFAEGLKSEGNPNEARSEFTYTATSDGGEGGDDENGNKEHETPAVPLDTSVATNIVGYVVLGLVAVCAVFALVLCMCGKRKIAGDAKKKK